MTMSDIQTTTSPGAHGGAHDPVREAVLEVCRRAGEAARAIVRFRGLSYHIGLR